MILKSIGTAVIVTIINLIVEIVIYKLIGFIGLVSLSEEVTQRVILSFLIQYINIAFVVFVIF